MGGNEDEPVTPGERLKRLRKHLGYSLRQVERLTAARVRSSHLSQIENGRVHEPSLSVLRELAPVYGMPLTVLITIIYGDEGHEGGAADATGARAAAYFSRLSPGEQQMALEFLRFLATGDDQRSQEPDADGG